MRLTASEVWRATRTPEGPATLHVAVDGESAEARAWGPGAEWALDAAPELLGASDDDAGFRPRHAVVAALHRELRGLRICRSRAVTEALVPTVIEQKVAGKEARRSYAALVRRWGEPAPGGQALLLPPSPERLRDLPYYAFHPLGVERRRADVVRRAATVAHRLEETTSMPLDAAYRRLTAVPGVGTWSAAEVGLLALGDPDAVPVGDYGLPSLVTFSLAGIRRGDDATMLELLEPYRGHRGRVIRLLVAGGAGPARRAPRAPLRSIATI
ncbi:MAG TPA: hypothetical protein VGJ70_16160 [Solirubrobacteraceae bacterium]